LQQLKRFSTTEIDIDPYLGKLKNTALGYDNISTRGFLKYAHMNWRVLLSLLLLILLILALHRLTGLLLLQLLSLRFLSLLLSLEFCPILATTNLSRIAEKLLVAHWIRPAFTDIDIRDQFAFKPTGSTDCALIYRIDNITKMLETNNY
jgi:hypothetical protein